jgi:hypothetical protein
MSTRVQDATGAVVPNAQVTILHAATSESRQTRSNERGEFSLSFRIGLEAGGVSETSLAWRPTCLFVAGGGRFALHDVLLDGVDNNTSTNSGNVFHP